MSSHLVGRGYRIGGRVLVTLISALLANGCTANGDGVNRLAQHDAPEIGLRFGYPADLYMARIDHAGGEAPKVSIVLVENLPANVAYLRGASTELMEGPPMITIDAYENPEALTAADWFHDRTNWGSRVLELRSSVTGDRERLEYRWDGLYAGRTVMIAGSDHIYVLSVTWVSEADRLPAAFDSLLATIELTER